MFHVNTTMQTASEPSTQRALNLFRAMAQRSTLVVRHERLKDAANPVTTEDARQRQCHAVFFVIRTDRNHSVLIPKHDLRDTRTGHPNPVLAGIVSLDNGYIRIANFLLHFCIKSFRRSIALLQQFTKRSATYPCR